MSSNSSSNNNNSNISIIIIIIINSRRTTDFKMWGLDYLHVGVSIPRDHLSFD
jgi:hypothetical protein